MRLAAQIHDLREAGVDIEAVAKVAEDGQKYTRYYLRDEPLAA
jgi:Helix-turn-helix domain